MMVISMEMKVFGQLLTMVWRAFHDGQLGVALVKLDNTHSRLERLGAAGASPHPATVWLVVAGVCGHFIVHMIRSLDIAFNVPNLRFEERVNFVLTNILEILCFCSLRWDKIVDFVYYPGRPGKH